ncbi:MAG: HAMP domain-containing sensor histidine kinase [Chloroflexota bacterium]
MRPKHFSRPRPHWWPADEPWPPHGPPRAWRERRAMRGHFVWRMGCFFAAFMLLAVTFALSLAFVVSSLLGALTTPNGAPMLWPNWGWALVVVLFVGVWLVGRTLRRAATPLADVMDGVGRVAEGDYSVRVAERGPRAMRSLARAFNTMAERLQRNDELRRDLMADVAHELRTPLAVIQGNLEGVLDGVYPRDDAHLAPILDETRVLSRLIDDLRTLALAESGALKLQTEPTDLAVLLSETVNSFRAQAEGNGVTLTVDVAGDLPLLDVDPTRIREVATNLIANALRYTPRSGAVRVRATFDATSQRATVSVGDSGAGIAPEALPHIFERFYKASNSRGSGLGLTIAKNLVAAHGGEMSAQSEVGKGTTITFTLPKE